MKLCRSILYSELFYSAKESVEIVTIK